MSRIESGRMELKEEKFSFREFLEQICIIVGGQCEDKGLQFVCSREAGLEDFYVGDSLKLKQVLINVLGNSVKFTDAPGTITFTAAQTACDDDRATLRFVMADTGIGMDKAFIPRLFEAFSQEDNENITRYGGSGRLEWWCLDWNKPSIDFYLSLGAEPMSDWTTYRIAGETLMELAKE